LGATPIWTRTDLPQPEGVNDEDGNQVEEGSSAPIPRHKRGPNLDDDVSDFDDEDRFVANIRQTDEQRPLRKRIPPRTPYGLFNKDPIPVSSDAEVRALIAHAAVEKERKLLVFLNDPEKSVKVLLSSYMRKEGLIWHVCFFSLFIYS
jgi:hypothetical protein